MENVTPYSDKLSYWSSHRQIARLLADLSPGSRVLDVGAGLGTLARLSDGKDFVLRGIEPNIAWLSPVQGLYSEVYEGTLEQTPDTYLKGNDAVVCADVLEHLAYPEEQLKRLVIAQPDHCIFLISVPNIANIWMRISLLFGRFNYSDRGLLDRTHLHFYTKKTFLELLRNSKLEIIEFLATPIPIDLVASFFINNTIDRFFYAILAQWTNWWPTLLGYQWIAKAIKPGSS